MNVRNKLECLSLASLYSLVRCLRVRSVAYTRGNTHSGRLQPYSKTSAWVWKACRGKHSILLRTLLNYGCKKKGFYKIGTWLRVLPAEAFPDCHNTKKWEPKNWRSAAGKNLLRTGFDPVFVQNKCFKLISKFINSFSNILLLVLSFGGFESVRVE